MVSLERKKNGRDDKGSSTRSKRLRDDVAGGGVVREEQLPVKEKCVVTGPDALNVLRSKRKRKAEKHSGKLREPKRIDLGQAWTCG